jgi:hypothetical protein
MIDRNDDCAGGGASSRDDGVRRALGRAKPRKAER